MIVKLFSDPLVIFCVVLLVGFTIGKLRICGFSLDLSAILLVAVFLGILLAGADDLIDLQGVQTTMKTLSSFGTMLFIGAIGIHSGKLLQKGLSKTHIYGFLIGVWMVITAILTMKLLKHRIDLSTLAGILCGALTSTPGLATLSDCSHIDPSCAAIGYGSAYIGGVLGIVLFVQMVSKMKKVSFEPAFYYKKEHPKAPTTEAFIFLQATILMGRVMGCISIPVLNFSLGSSGGILCSGILLGFVSKRNGDYSLFRNIGLMMFLAGTGISAGVQFSGAFILKNIFIGILFTAIPILSGCVACRCFKIDMHSALAIIAGGMTSSPAFGVLMKKQKEDSVTSVYSMSYLGALCAIVIGMRML